MQAPAKNSHRGHNRKMPRFAGEGVPATPNMHRGYKRSGYDFASGVTNHLYTPMVITNASGAVVERYSYTAYGERSIVGAASKVSQVGNGRGFTGQQIDAETGLMYFRARMYSTSQGRFLLRDFGPKYGIKMSTMGHSLYHDGYSLYGGHFVPNHFDPMGLSRKNGDCGSSGCFVWNSQKCECEVDQASVARDASNYATCIGNAEDARKKAEDDAEKALERYNDETDEWENKEVQSCKDKYPTGGGPLNALQRAACIKLADATAGAQKANNFIAYSALVTAANIAYITLVSDCDKRYPCRKL